MARINIRFLSKSLYRKTEVNLILPSLDLHGSMREQSPDYYRENGQKYPLLVLLSGFSDDDEGWLANSDIVALCDRYRVAAALVGGENRWYVDSGPMDRWHAYLCEELPDFLYGNFSKLDRGCQILGGVSMGGYGALYNGLKCPQSYSAIMALSPALKPDGYIDEGAVGTLKDLFLSARGKLPPVYLSVGDRDFIYGQSAEFNGWLRENGTGAEYRFVEGYDHSWALWKLEIVRFLEFLKQKNIIGQDGNAGKNNF